MREFTSEEIILALSLIFGSIFIYKEFFLINKNDDKLKDVNNVENPFLKEPFEKSGYRCSQTERKPTGGLQDIIENVFQRSVNKVTTNLAGFNRRDPKKIRQLKLKASLRPENEVESLNLTESQNVYSKSSYELERNNTDRLKQSANRMQNDVPISEFTTILGQASGISGVSRYFHGVREMPHVPLTKRASSLRSHNGDVQTNTLGLGVNKSGGSRENYSNLGIIDRKPKEREYDGLVRFPKGRNRQGGTTKDKNLLGVIDIQRFGDHIENAVRMSRGVTGNIVSNFLGDLEQRNYKSDTLHKQRTYRGRNTENAAATSSSRGVESRTPKPEIITSDRHWVNAKAIEKAQNNPTNIFTEYEHSYK